MGMPERPLCRRTLLRPGKGAEIRGLSRKTRTDSAGPPERGMACVLRRPSVMRRAVHAIDDSGFRHLRVRLVVADVRRSPELLTRLFEDPDVSATIVAAGTLGEGAFFEMELFGLGSKVDELLATDPDTGADLHGAEATAEGPSPAVLDSAPDASAEQEDPALELIAELG